MFRFNTLQVRADQQGENGSVFHEEQDKACPPEGENVHSAKPTMMG
jgi:hypothetical protein